MEEAAQALRQALAAPGTPGPDAVTAPACFVLALWFVGDRYRMLLRLAPQDLGVDGVDGVLAPARETAASIIARGGGREPSMPAFPSGPLSRALEGHLLGLLECVNAGTWIDDGARTATAALIAMGVGGDRAVTCVRGLGRPMSLGGR